jgi:hypothetical protein
VANKLSIKDIRVTKVVDENKKYSFDIKKNAEEIFDHLMYGGKSSYLVIIQSLPLIIKRNKYCKCLDSLRHHNNSCVVLRSLICYTLQACHICFLKKKMKEYDDLFSKLI